MKRLRVAILFGGRSEEHPVSVKSAQQVAKHLDPDRYEAFYVGITKSGVWILCDGPDGDWENGRGRRAMLSPDTSVHGLVVLERMDTECVISGQYETICLDLVFPVLHGRLGEDGAIQGLLELSGIPYVGCDVQTSALCMDKSLAYVVARNAGIATPQFWIVEAIDCIDPERLMYPVFVKPARSGSSFGVTKVSRKEDLPNAVDIAKAHDSKVLIEEAVTGSEIGCAVLGNTTNLVVGELDRVSLSHGYFRIHQESQPESGSENATFVVPADVPPETRQRAQETAKTLYRSMGCKGLARIDMFLKEDGTLVLNEINTLPGMTSYSRYPRMMKAAGISFSEVIDRIVALAMTRA